MQSILPEVLPLREASRGMIRELGFLGDTYEEGGVTHAQCHVLLELKARALTVGELAELLRLDKSTVSRTLAELAARGFVRGQRDDGDARKKPFSLTARGARRVASIDAAASQRVTDALLALSEHERETAVHGLCLYATALTRSRRRKEFTLRPIERRDDPAVAALIRAVMPEFGARGPGFAINDPEVDAMFEAYDGPRSAYFVFERAGRVVGGGGYAPLVGGGKQVAELRKMYLYPEARGFGLGEALLDHVLGEMRRAGFRVCYLETLAAMTHAQKLYERKGFSRLAAPKGKTGHFGCDRWYEKSLRRSDEGIARRRGRRGG